MLACGILDRWLPGPPFVQQFCGLTLGCVALSGCLASARFSSACSVLWSQTLKLSLLPVDGLFGLFRGLEIGWGQCRVGRIRLGGGGQCVPSCSCEGREGLDVSLWKGRDRGTEIGREIDIREMDRHRDIERGGHNREKVGARLGWSEFFPGSRVE